MHLVITERTPARRCAYCSTNFLPTESTTCEGCQTHYHDACLRELKGGCGTIGCSRTKPPSKARRERVRARRRERRLGTTVDRGAGWTAWIPAFIGFSFMVGDGPTWIAVSVIVGVLAAAFGYSKSKTLNHPLD